MNGALVNSVGHTREGNLKLGGGLGIRSFQHEKERIETGEGGVCENDRNLFDTCVNCERIVNCGLFKVATSYSRSRISTVLL